VTLALFINVLIIIIIIIIIIRTYGASILGFLAHTELDTRHPLSKILDPPLTKGHEFLMPGLDITARLVLPYDHARFS